MQSVRFRKVPGRLKLPGDRVVRRSERNDKPLRRVLPPDYDGVDGELMLLALAMGKVLRRTTAQLMSTSGRERPARASSSTFHSLPCGALRPKCFHTNRCASSCGTTCYSAVSMFPAVTPLRW
ncbi:hypothetical protein KCP73_16960 [Salmonella enterica subsp. enterica]|nr:hypothetical protein KCP73_16960 [Salmonella enterica subsp. enterica]